MQDDTLFSGSIAENIAMFPSAIDFDKVEHCADLACISEDIKRLTMQYQSLVGHMGTMLSGGQIQRTLLARAYYKDSSILILDEATSHLDKESELNVFKNIETMGKTVLSTAHNQLAMDIADRIFCLEAYEEDELV